MSNFKCNKCGFINIDCGKDGYKTPKEIELELKVKDLEEEMKKSTELEDLKKECEELKKDCGCYRYLAEKYHNSYHNSCILNIETTTQMFKYEQALRDIQRYCFMQNLKYDETACEILNIVINNLKENE